MIRFTDISLSIQGQNLLEQTGLLVSPGDKVVIRGPSGCGKSSLLKTVIGALPFSGRLSVNGVELQAKTAAEIRSRIAFIDQEPALGAERVREALFLPFTYKAHQHRRPNEELVHQTLKQLRLDPRILSSESKRISGGEKQRIAIARALLLGKTIFIADEITSALDPESKQAVMDELFRPEVTILSVSHDPDWILACSRTVEFQNRKLTEVPHDD